MVSLRSLFRSAGNRMPATSEEKNARKRKASKTQEQEDTVSNGACSVTTDSSPVKVQQKADHSVSTLDNTATVTTVTTATVNTAVTATVEPIATGTVDPAATTADDSKNLVGEQSTSMGGKGSKPVGKSSAPQKSQSVDAINKREEPVVKKSSTLPVATFQTTSTRSVNTLDSPADDFDGIINEDILEAMDGNDTFASLGRTPVESEKKGKTKSKRSKFGMPKLKKLKYRPSDKPIASSAPDPMIEPPSKTSETKEDAAIVLTVKEPVTLVQLEEKATETIQLEEKVTETKVKSVGTKKTYADNLLIEKTCSEPVEKVASKAQPAGPTAQEDDSIDKAYLELNKEIELLEHFVNLTTAAPSAKARQRNFSGPDESSLDFSRDSEGTDDRNPVDQTLDMTSSLSIISSSGLRSHDISQMSLGQEVPPLPDWAVYPGLLDSSLEGFDLPRYRASAPLFRALSPGALSPRAMSPWEQQAFAPLLTCQHCGHDMDTSPVSSRPMSPFRVASPTSPPALSPHAMAYEKRLLRESETDFFRHDLSSEHSPRGLSSIIEGSSHSTMTQSRKTPDPTPISPSATEDVPVFALPDLTRTRVGQRPEAPKPPKRIYRLVRQPKTGNPEKGAIGALAKPKTTGDHGKGKCFYDDIDSKAEEAFRQTATPPPLSNSQQKSVYKDVLKGGEIPVSGFRRPEPEKPERLHHETKPAPPLSPPSHPSPALRPNSPLLDRATRDRLEAQHREQVRLVHEKTKEKRREKEVEDQSKRKHNYVPTQSSMNWAFVNDSAAKISPFQKSPISPNRYDHVEATKAPTNQKQPTPVHQAPVAKQPSPAAPVTTRELKPSASKAGHRHSYPQWQQPQQAWAVYSFTAQSPKEVSFKRGEQVLVRRQIDSNWGEAEVNGKRGIFPLNHVQLENPGEGEGSSRGSVASPTPSSPAARQVDGQGRVKYNFRAQTSVELPLVKGEIVTITRRVDQNWLEGVGSGGRRGIFPSSYVDVMKEPTSPPAHPPSVPRPQQPRANGPPAGPSQPAGSRPRSASYRSGGYSSQQQQQPPVSSRQPQQPQPQRPVSSRQQPPVNSRQQQPPQQPRRPADAGTVYRAVFTYMPQNEDELALQEGDLVSVVERCDDGWFVGTSHRTGRLGTFPGNYVSTKSS